MKSKNKAKKNPLTVVTGSNGLIGSALRKVNPPNTVFLTREDANLTDFSAVKTLFNFLKPDRVIHLAAMVAGIGGNIIHSGDFFRINILINTNVLEASRLAGAKRLISLMSTCVFPDNTSYPLKVEHIHNGPPHPSNFGYAYAKRMLEVQSSAYRKEWNCNYIVAIPTNTYGPHDIWNIEDGHVIPSLIHKCYLAKKNKTDWVIWGSGSPLREFVFSKDIAELILWLIENYEEEVPIILSSSKEISIKELVELIAKIMKFKGKIVYDKTKPEGQFRKPSDNSHLTRLLPDFKLTPIEEGLTKTITWFEKNYPNVRM